MKNFNRNTILRARNAQRKLEEQRAMERELHEAYREDITIDVYITDHGTVFAQGFGPRGDLWSEINRPPSYTCIERCYRFSSRSEAERACTNEKFSFWLGSLGREARSMVRQTLCSI